MAYTFDAQGRRKSKTAGGATTIFAIDADNREVLEYDGATGAVQRWYTYGQGSNEVLNQMDVAAGTRTTLIPDIQGSIVATLASNSATIARANFLPYGENPSVTTGTFRYTASRIDPETGGTASQPSGLTYMRARMYSPTWGRFLQPDPIGYQGGSNLYAYVGNNPLNRTDHNGTSQDSPSGGAYDLAGTQTAGNIFTDAWAYAKAHPGQVIGGALIGGGAVACAVIEPCGAVVGGALGLGGGAAEIGTGATAAETLEAGATEIELPTNGSQLGHIFRDAEGHLPDTGANRQLLQDVANDTRTTMGTDQYGNTWSAKTLPDGAQAWTQTRNGQIINGGLNQTPRVFNPQTGLSAPKP